MVIENLILPFIKKADLERRKKELKKAIGALSKEEQKIKELKKELRRIERTEKLLTKPLPTFYFWYCNEKASSIAEFASALQRVPLESLNHHAEHHDFSKWLESKVPKSFLTLIKNAEEKRNEELRNALLKAIEHYTKKKAGIK